jgi:hypothetical protein
VTETGVTGKVIASKTLAVKTNNANAVKSLTGDAEWKIIF